MALDGDYDPSPWSWVRDQVDAYERSDGANASTLRDTGYPIIVVTNRGARSGNIRKTPLMRVEHDGRYAAVASQGGAPKHPYWYFNLLANPLVQLQDGAARTEMIAREVTGEEKARWWARAVTAYPPYAEYQANTDRQIPVFVLEPPAD
jgi:deazaflavin-dependent oxidoreductase (nitroreductase family)